MSCTNSLSVICVSSRILHEASAQSLTINAPVTVLVSLADHLINLVICKLLADRGHDVAQFSGRDEAVIVTVENLGILVRNLRIARGGSLWRHTLKASRISSSESVSFIFLAIMVRNSRFLR